MSVVTRFKKKTKIKGEWKNTSFFSNEITCRLPVRFTFFSSSFHLFSFPWKFYIISSKMSVEQQRIPDLIYHRNFFYYYYFYLLDLVSYLEILSIYFFFFFTFEENSIWVKRSYSLYFFKLHYLKNIYIKRSIYTTNFPKVIHFSDLTFFFYSLYINPDISGFIIFSIFYIKNYLRFKGCSVHWSLRW